MVSFGSFRSSETFSLTSIDERVHSSNMKQSEKEKTGTFMRDTSKEKTLIAVPRTFSNLAFYVICLYRSYATDSHSQLTVLHANSRLIHVKESDILKVLIMQKSDYSLDEGFC